MGTLADTAAYELSGTQVCWLYPHTGRGNRNFHTSPSANIVVLRKRVPNNFSTFLFSTNNIKKQDQTKDCLQHVHSLDQMQSYSLEKEYIQIENHLSSV